MLKNSLVYFILWIFLLLLVEINCQMKPIQRYDHTATLIDNKLYILGGYNDELQERTKGFFYLDVSVKFNTKNLLWQDLSSINTVPLHHGAASVKGGANNNTLFLYGGEVGDDVKTPLVHTFDPQSNSWTIPKIVGVNTIRNRELRGIIDNNGKMYLWGGEGVSSAKEVNMMLILDTIDLSWGEGNLVGVPTSRDSYGAVLLPDRKIIYMGGRAGATPLALNRVYLYDIDNDNWSTQTTSGKIPSNRAAFSAVLGLDNQRVIIYGGRTTAGVAAPGDSLYVLDISKLEWYIPKVSGNIQSVRRLHMANVIGKYMVISFGVGQEETESDILLLDISNDNEYVWTEDFIPLTTSPTASNKSSASLPTETLKPSPSTQTNNKSVIIGGTIGSLIGGILLGIGGSFLYKWNKNKRKEKKAIPTPGNAENYDYHANLVIPTRSNQGQGQETISIINDRRPLASQNIDGNILQQLTNEIQSLRQELHMQNSGQKNNGQ